MSTRTVHTDPIRVGLLVPSVNTVVEPEMYRMAPPGVTIHFSRLPVPSDVTTVENLERLEEHLEDSLRSLAQADIKAVSFACTSGSFIKGRAWDRHLIERMEKILSPATTTSESVVSALRHLKVNRLGLLTPYPDEINHRMVSYLSDQGFAVICLNSFRLSRSQEIRRVPPERVYEMGKSTNTEETEGLLISCTDLPTISVIEDLEGQTGKPVVTSNQATLWKLLHLAGVKARIKGFGRLLNPVSIERMVPRGE